jgi:PleD family two-component response regulator
VEVGGTPVTISIGLAPHEDGEGAGALVARADAALYAAKRGGRDRVEVAGGEAASR